MTSDSGSVISVAPRGQDQVARGDVLTGGAAGDVDLDAVGQLGGVGLDRDGAQLVVRDRVRRDVADDDDRDLDRDLLAATDEEQVDVLEGALQRVALDGLGERELLRRRARW